MNNPECRLCGASDTEHIGRIPDGDFFAGRVLAERIRGGHLHRCLACRSMFKHPVLTPAQYETLYRSGLATQWTGLAGREDWRIIREIVTERPGAVRVLDVGCGTGDFLACLPEACRKSGIEPSEAAAHARRRGVTILGGDLRDVAASSQFDFITIIDVIEHVNDPGSLLAQAFALLAPGGQIIVSTGDPDARVWRSVFGSRFWYSSFPEHIVFPSSEFVRQWCEARGAAMGEKRSTRYRRIGIARAALDLAMQVVFYLSPSSFSAIAHAAAGFAGQRGLGRRVYSPAVPGLFEDHQILTIERRG